ncbi:MAG: PqqD family protein [Actinomycetota bacterium]|nr:PqqD family protein [Actinomycetota bacterium]
MGCYKNKSVLFTGLEEGGILLDLDTKAFFSLTETGARIWSLLYGGLCAADIAKKLSAEFSASQEKTLVSTDRLIKELEKHRLIVRGRG